MISFKNLNFAKILAYLVIIFALFISSYINVVSNSVVGLFQLFFSLMNTTLFSTLIIFSLNTISISNDFSRNKVNIENSLNWKKRFVSYVFIFFSFIMSSSLDILFAFLVTGFPLIDIIVSCYNRTFITSVMIILLIYSISINVGKDDDV